MSMSRRSLLQLRLPIAFASCKQALSPSICDQLSSPTGFAPEIQDYSVQTYRHHFTAAGPSPRSRAAVEQSSALAPAFTQKRCFIGESATAKHHHERRLLGYSQEQLYAVVSAVEHYKEFVPWCQRSVVVQRRPPDFIEAELEVGFKMFVERYSSQVYLTEPSKVLSKVSDSTLFDHLDTTWEFKAGPTPSTTWLNFDIDFAFKSPLYRQIASIFFDEVVKRMMNAFEGRCKVLYGESTLAQKRRMQA